MPQHHFRVVYRVPVKLDDARVRYELIDYDPEVPIDYADPDVADIMDEWVKTEARDAIWNSECTGTVIYEGYW